jgi:type IV secretion system protein TrbL
MSLVLASLALLGLGIFGPSIASGLVAGAPQLGAGAAVGTVAAGAGTMIIGGGGAVAGARALGGGAMAAMRAGTSMGSAASTAYRLGQETSGSPTIGAGFGGVAQAAGSAARDRLSNLGGLGDAAERGQRAAFMAGARTSGAAAAASPSEDAGEAPPWAQQLRSEQAARDHRQLALHTIRDGDRGGAGANPDISERED